MLFAATARLMLTASLAAAPCLALAQANSPTTAPANPAAGTVRPINPAVDPTAPAAIAPAPPVTAREARGTPTPLSPALTARPRSSQIIGSRLYNDSDQNIGEVDDLLLTAAGPMAIIQVGGFLGIGGRLVSMPLGDLRWNSDRDRLVLPGATKEALEARPAFEYGATRPR